MRPSQQLQLASLVVLKTVPHAFQRSDGLLTPPTQQDQPIRGAFAVCDAFNSFQPRADILRIQAIQYALHALVNERHNISRRISVRAYKPKAFIQRLKDGFIGPRHPMFDLGQVGRHAYALAKRFLLDTTGQPLPADHRSGNSVVWAHALPHPLMPRGRRFAVPVPFYFAIININSPEAHTCPSTVASPFTTYSAPLLRTSSLCTVMVSPGRTGRRKRTLLMPA